MTTKTNYSKKLQNPKWQRKRLEIMKRDKFQCRLCKDDETELQVHHKEYINGSEPWEYENNQLITVCSHCHEEIEHLKKDAEVNYSRLKIYKSNSWTNGSRIMFISHDHKCLMRIYDDNDKYLTGYCISGYALHDMIKIFKQSL